MQYPRPHSGPYYLSALSPKRLEELIDIKRGTDGIGLTYEALFTLLTLEFNDAKACSSYNDACNKSRLPAREALLAGLQDCHRESVWYSILKALDDVTPMIWNALDDDGKETYIKRLRGDHTNLSYGMASVHALKLLSYVDEHNLHIKTGPRTISLKENRFLVDWTDDSLTQSDEFDYIINATGIGSDFASHSSPLITSLISKGWMRQHKHGGVVVDFATGNVVSTNGTSAGDLYALAGSLTYGTYLLTHCLFQLWESSERTSTAIIRSLIDRCPRSF